MKVKLDKKKASIIVAVILVIFLTGNVFAAVLGAPNIFFAIRDLVSKEDVVGEENLLSDRDITISYSPIKIKDGVNLQINRILIEKDKSTLFITLKNDNENDEEIGFNVYDLLENGNINNVIAEEKILVGAGESESPKITLEKSVSTTEKLLAEIIIDRKEVGRNITIDLATKEIIVEGEEEVAKLSQVELKEYLGCLALLNTDYATSDWHVYVAEMMNEKIFKIENPKSHSEMVTGIIDSIFLEASEKTTVNGKEIYKVYNELYTYNKSKDAYVEITKQENPLSGLCLNINDISYKEGRYIIDFTYCLPRAEDYDNQRIESLEQYKTTIELVLDKESKYSKYKIVNLETAELIKPADNYGTNNENNNKVENNTQNDSCNHDFEVQQWNYSVNQHTTLEGTHDLVCKKCKEKSVQQHNYKEWFDISSESVKAWTLWCEDCKGYIYTTDENFVKTSGYKVKKNEDTANKEMVYVLKSDSFKLGNEYEIFYFDTDKNYRSVKCIAKVDGELELVLTKSGTYQIGIVMDRSTEETKEIRDCNGYIQADSKTGEVTEVQ